MNSIGVYKLKAKVIGSVSVEVLLVYSSQDWEIPVSTRL